MSQYDGAAFKGSDASGAKVVLVAHQYWPTPGPATIRLGALTAALVSKGLKVEVWTTGDATQERDVLVGPHGERVEIVQNSRTRSGTSVRRLISLVAFARAIAARASKSDRDERVAFISDPPPTAALVTSLIAGRRNTPYVYYLCDSWALASDSGGRVLRALRSVFGWMERFALRRAALTISVTEGLTRYASDSGASSVVQSKNGADFSIFNDRVEPVALGGVDPSVPLLTYAGTAGVVHGATIFADAAEMLWAEGLQFQVLFVGTGSDMDTLAQRAAALPHGSLIVHEAIAPEAVAGVLRASDASLVSLAPGHGYADARPTKALASLAVGTPVVYAGAGVFRDELQSAGVGFFADWNAKDVASAMRAAVVEAASSSNSRQHIADYARDHFDSQEKLDEVAELIKKLRRKT